MRAMLNRAALIVRPLQPYLDWAKSLDDSGLVPNQADEKTVYLVADYGNDQEADQVLRGVYAEVFERELFAWHTDENDWPKKRTFAVFKQWFAIEMHSMVEDLCSDAIEDDDGDA